jgi:hypothetical protein
VFARATEEQYRIKNIAALLTVLPRFSSTYSPDLLALFPLD